MMYNCKSLHINLRASLWKLFRVVVVYCLMKRVVFVTGIALFLSAGWLIRTRHFAATRNSTVRSEPQKNSNEPLASEEEFRQKIRGIVQKVAADVKKEQASIASPRDKAAL